MFFYCNTEQIFFKSPDQVSINTLEECFNSGKFKNKNVFSKILDLIDSTAENKSVIEMCGHAMYIGIKKEA